MNQYSDRTPKPRKPAPARSPPAPRVAPSSSHPSTNTTISGSDAPFNLGLIGLHQLEILSSASITLDEIAWLQLGSPARAATPDGRVVVGLAPVIYDTGLELLGLAICTGQRSLHVDCASWHAAKDVAQASIEVLESELFTSDKVLIVGFDLQMTAVGIRRDLGKDLMGVDVSSAGLSPGEETRQASTIVQSMFGNKQHQGIAALWQHNSALGHADDHGSEYSSLRAWLAFTCARHSSKWPHILVAKEVDTRRVYQEQIEFFTTAHIIQSRLEALKPRTAKGEFTKATTKPNGEIEIQNAKFSTKVRKDHGQTLRLTTADGQRIDGASVKEARGRKATIFTPGDTKVEQLAEFEIIGRASGTLADSQWQAYMRGALEGTISVYESEHNTRILWYKTRHQRARRAPVVDPAAAALLETSPAADRLNPSQRLAHDAITAPFNRRLDKGSTLLITGPPGTGKTSVISASVRTWLLRHPSPSSLCIYCVTASNVAAKNISESLAASGFNDFRLVVSHDFYNEWHEHRYSLGKKLVTSRELPPTLELGELEERMGGVRVVIATLSMLSSHNLMENHFFSSLPMGALLIDEASQIRLDEYPHVFNRFKKTLERVAFFGDAQQLAPYNSAQVPQIQSVFQLPHLKVDAFFLDTQYRMPSLVGDFISREVYGSKLRSATSVSSSKDCLRFIDVASGSEEYSGHSTKNVAELDVVISLVQHYYSDKNFKILTPYDAQRNCIETALKDAGLPWEDRCFNVDSFQGQEDDIIIISVVKTAKLGFLNEIRRSNVMLTRLKKAMIIVTNKNFLYTVARSTLLGKMASVLTSPKLDWVTETSAMDGTADLPERGAARLSVAPVRRVPAVINEVASEADWGPEWDVGGKAETSEDVKAPKIPLGDDWGAAWEVGGGTLTPAKESGGAAVEDSASGLREGIDAGWW